jgi:ribosomal protein S18 acetylase RimI-like enzyme
VTAVTIRPWTVRDRDEVQSLLSLFSAAAVVRNDAAPTFVAEADGRVVGMVTLCFLETLTGRKAYVDHLVVLPEARQAGVGRALMTDAIERARSAGASRIDLTAGPEKQAGRALYRSLGFEQRETGVFRLQL